MFEDQVEKRTSFVPLLLILVLLAVILGGIGYWFLPSQQGMTEEEARAAVSAALKEKGPAIVHFHIGIVQPSIDEKPRDPHYRLLEKAGVLRLNPRKDLGVLVALTPQGEQLLAQIPGLVKTKNPDDTEAYTVPLAERKLVSVDKLTLNGRNWANVEFTWKWEPNEVGDAFDAAGPQVKRFNTWERTTLIQKYGVDFFHNPPTRTSLAFTRVAQGWALPAE